MNWLKLIPKMGLRTKGEIIIAALLIVSVVALNMMWKKERKERIRTESNQTALLQTVERFRTKDGLNAVSIQKLTLKNSEFKKYNQDLAETVKSLNIKVKRLQSVSETVTKTVTKVNTVIKDSIIYRDNTIVDTLRCIEFSDGWVSANGCVLDGVLHGEIVSKDTLIQAVHRVPRKFLFFRWGAKAIRQEVVSKNPHTQIEYSKYIEFE